MMVKPINLPSGKLTYSRPWQIGVGRLVSNKKWIFRVYVSLPRSNYYFHPNLRCLKLEPPPYVPGSKDGQTMINIGICLSYENGLMTIPLYQESTQRPWHLSCFI